MVCIIKKDPVNKKNLQDLAKIVGSEEAAYYLLCANNGFPLNKTPQGEDSALYAELTRLYGDQNKAILAKAQAYLPEMGDWVDHSESTTLALDRYGEPSIKYLTNIDPNTLDVSTVWNADDVTEILRDNGQLNEILELLRDNNIVDRTAAIEEAILKGRDSFIAMYLQELSKYEDITPVAKYINSQDARREWNERTQDKIIKQIQNRLADTFHLKKITKGFYTYFEGDETTQTGKVQVRFVNNISKLIKDAPEGTAGAYSEDINHLMSVLYISLQNGDHTTIVHELLHRYIRNFWDTQPVQDALKVVENRKTKGNPIQIEERLVQKIIKLLDIDGKQNQSFWSKMNNILSKAFSFINLNKVRMELLDDLSMYFAINKDLSDMVAETIFFEKYYEPVFQQSATSQQEKDILSSIKNTVATRIKAVTHEPVANNKLIADLRELDQHLSQLDSENPDDIEDAIRSVLVACRDELNDVILVLGRIVLDGIHTLDAGELQRLNVNTIGYYKYLLDDKINQIFKYNSNNPAFDVNSQLYHHYLSTAADLNQVLREFKKIIIQWNDWYIDKTAEELITFANPDIWKYNAKKWVRNEINRGNLGWLNQLFGAINSESPIINIIDHLVRRMRNRITPEVNYRGHELVDLFDKYTNHISFLPTNRFRDFIEHSFKRDASGRRGMTGNFRRSENHGEMQAAVNKAKIKIAKEVGIILDENLRFDWKEVTTDQYNSFYSKLDDFYEQNDIIRRYKPDYYRIQRKYLSPETIELRRELREEIDLIENKCRNQKTGVVETFNLKTTELQKLHDLKKRLQDMSNPYDIIQDDYGNIISIQEKDPDTTEGRIAYELIQFRNAIRDKVSYYPNQEQFDKDLQQLTKQGATAYQIYQWKAENTMHKIIAGTFIAGGPKTQELALLYAKRSAIINSTKPTQGYDMPNLDLLNDEAWMELKDLDQEIADLEKDIFEAGGSLPSGSIDPSANIDKMQVLHRVNGTITSETQLQFMYNQQVTQMLSINPNAEQDFLDKYYYWVYEQDEMTKKWVLSHQEPLTAFYTLIAHNPDYVADEPTGKYTRAVGSLVETLYDDSQRGFIQPKPKGKWHDAEFVKLYGDGTTEYAKVYNKFIEIMGEIYQNYGMVDTNKYQLPGIRDDGNHSFYRRGYWNMSQIRERMGLNETDTEYNEETAIRPDGSVVQTIPMRWINKLSNPNLTSTDLIRTVMMMYECSLEYKEKNQILPIIEILSSQMSDSSAQKKFINSYTDQYIYGRGRTNKMSPVHSEKDNLGKTNKIWLNKLADEAMHRTHSKLMAHNWKVVVKNAIDSFFNFLQEMSGKKYFTTIDAISSMGHLIGELLTFWKRNTGIVNVRTLTGAMMQRNRLSGSTSELFKGQRSSFIRRFLAKHFNMGEYTLVDYLWKGLIARCVYHNHRLIENPNTGKKEFMNKWQAAYQYSKAGKTEADGINAWTKAGRIFGKSETLADAYYVGKNGDLLVKDEYKDYVTELLETRVETIIHERSGVINGILDQMDRPTMLTNTIGALIGQMRGWMFSQSADNYKVAHQLLLFEEDLQREELKDLGLTTNKKRKLKEKGKVKKDPDGNPIYFKWYEDEEFTGLANLSSGFMENGRFQGGLIRAYGRCISAIFYINKIFKIRKPTKQNIYQVRNVTVSILSMAFVIALSVLFGKMVEDDPKSVTKNALYATNTGVMSERVSQLPMGVVLSMLELIRSITVTKTLYEDAGYIPSLVVDGVQYYQYEHGHINTAPYDKQIKRDAYKGLRKWQKDLLKTWSILSPQTSPDNIRKNFSKASHVSSENFYNNQFPQNWINYLPNRGSGVTNITTEMFKDTNLPMVDKNFNPLDMFLNTKGSFFGD